jgi:hypothetical protein
MQLHEPFWLMSIAIFVARASHVRPTHSRKPLLPSHLSASRVEAAATVM